MQSNSFAIKLLENIVVSYLYAAVTFLILNGSNKINFTVLQGAAYAGIPAALAVAKGFLATFVGSKESPALTE